MGHAWFRQIRLLACALVMPRASIMSSHVREPRILRWRWSSLTALRFLGGRLERLLNAGEFTLPAEVPLTRFLPTRFCPSKIEKRIEIAVPYGDDEHDFHNDRYS